MAQKEETSHADTPQENGDPSSPDVGFPGGPRDLSAAIELLVHDKPLVLNEGFLVTDVGTLVMSQYVDIGVNKLRHRPATVVKSTEARYGIEYAPAIQVSAPFRFRDYGETFIHDDQEGRARNQIKTETPPRSYEAQNKEQERALSLLGQEGVTIRNTGSTSRDTETESMTFGGSSWIYCTSIPGNRAEEIARQAELPERYDHESVIRQPGKFALSLGEMFADQRGPQGKRGHFTHAGGTMSFHDSQLVLHGPVRYTDDVLGFLKARQQEEPLYHLFPLFVKHRDYRHQREYRFVLHCESPVEDETLRLYISGAMRDTLAPLRAAGRVEFRGPEDPRANSSSQKIGRPTPTQETMTRTRQRSSKQRRTMSVGGEVAQEEIVTSEETVVLTTRVPPGGLPRASDRAEASDPGVGEITQAESQERRIEGVVTDKVTRWRTRVFSIADTSSADKLFAPEDRDHAEELLKAVARPFGAFPALPQKAIDALQTLAHKASRIEPDVEVQAMSACWNGIWAICNLYECFGDVIASVGIEHNEFVAIALNESAHTGTSGKILVGPRGTFAYMLTRGDERRPGHGGTTDRLFFFPDEAARAAFEEFGWIPHEED